MDNYTSAKMLDRKVTISV